MTKLFNVLLENARPRATHLTSLLKRVLRTIDKFITTTNVRAASCGGLRRARSANANSAFKSKLFKRIPANSTRFCKQQNRASLPTPHDSYFTSRPHVRLREKQKQTMSSLRSLTNYNIMLASLASLAELASLAQKKQVI